MKFMDLLKEWLELRDLEVNYAEDNRPIPSRISDLNRRQFLEDELNRLVQLVSMKG